MGAQLFGVCPQRQEYSVELKSRLGLSFDLLHDEDHRVGTDYGLVFDTPVEVQEVEKRFGLNLPSYNNTADWRMPMPARVVIGTDGTVRAAEVQVDHALRTEPLDTLEVLRQLRR